MNTRPLTNIAPEVFRKRLLVEGYFTVDVTENKPGERDLPTLQLSVSGVLAHRRSRARIQNQYICSVAAIFLRT